MTRIRVVLSNMPNLLRDIVADALSTESDIEIAGEAHSIGELKQLLDSGKTDVVVAAERDRAFARDCGHLLTARGLPKLLVFTESGNAAYLHWMKLETSFLGQLTPEGLVHEIRAASRLKSVLQS